LGQRTVAEVRSAKNDSQTAMFFLVNLFMFSLSRVPVLVRLESIPVSVDE